MAQGLLDTGWTAALLHFNGNNDGTVITDESGKTWNVVSAFTKSDAYKFGPTSLYLSGSGSWVSTVDHADFYLVGNFTLDMWVRFSDFPVSGSYYTLWEQYQDATHAQIFEFQNSGGVHTLWFRFNNAGYIVNMSRACDSNLSLNTWYHFRVCRYGNDYKIYVDGSKIGATETAVGAGINFTGTVYIGCHAGGFSYFNGYIDEFRLVNGKAEVTGDSFVVPEISYAPHIDDAYTIHLLHCNGPDGRTLIVDETGIIWTAVGSAQIDTAQSKFGGSSLLFDGSGDYFSTPDSAIYEIGTQDFTLELWARFNALPGAGSWMGLWLQHVNSSDTWKMSIYNDGGTYKLQCEVFVGGTAYFFERRTLTGLVTNTWYHFAWSRQSLVNRMFWDGVKLGADAPDSSSFPNLAGLVYLGTFDTAAGTCMNGWIDEYRFSKGISKYNADFTPETAAFGPEIVHDVDLTAYDVHALYDNTLDVTLPLLGVDISASWELRILEVTLPLLGVSLNGLTGSLNTLDIPLPLLTANLNGLTGTVGEIDLDLPLPTVAFFGGGNLQIELPQLQVAANVLVGTVGEINTVLPRLVVDILAHQNEIGQLNVTLPRLAVNLTGTQHGFGSLAVTLPSLQFLGHGLSGTLGSLVLDLPQLKVNIHGYHSGRAVLDIVLPSLVVDMYGRVRPATVTYRGVVINTKNMAVTEYEGFEFNSLASIGNVSLAANENGIYALRGNRKGGGPIDSRILSGLLDFGKDVLTIPRDVWLSMRADGKLFLKVRTEEGEEYSYEVSGLKDAMHEERVKLGRGLKGRFFDFALNNVEGADFDLSKITVMVDAMRDRKR